MGWPGRASLSWAADNDEEPGAKAKRTRGDGASGPFHGPKGGQCIHGTEEGQRGPGEGQGHATSATPPGTRLKVNAHKRKTD